ncbi:MAG: PhzF family phenazine biosynthesis protein [Pseudomonadota bacterium]
MSTHRFVWVDAFTDRPFGGNPCAVVFDADAVPVETRLAYTRETRLSECAFVVASDTADFGARYYLATREIPLAGHPTIATCAALEAAGLLEGRDRFTLEVGAGVMPIEIRRRGAQTEFAMTQFAPVFGPAVTAGTVAEIYGLTAEDVVAPPQIVSTGTAFCVTVLRDHDALRRAKLDVAGLEALRMQVGGADAALMEPFLVTVQGAEAGDTFSRLLLAPPLPPEDPFTGSATGAMAAYLWHRGLIGRPDFVAEQGHWMGRPGSANVEVLGPPEAISGVIVAGSGVVLMEGTVGL